MKLTVKPGGGFLTCLLGQILLQENNFKIILLLKYNAERHGSVHSCGKSICSLT